MDAMALHWDLPAVGVGGWATAEQQRSRNGDQQAYSGCGERLCRASRYIMLAVDVTSLCNISGMGSRFQREGRARGQDSAHGGWCRLRGRGLAAGWGGGKSCAAYNTGC